MPVERISDLQRQEVEHVLEDVAAIVPIASAEVKSRPEVYDFLLDEMPFTGGIVRELGRGKWEIERDPKDPAAFLVVDPEGFRIRFDLILREPHRRFYVTRGVFQMGVLPPLKGSTIIVMRMIPSGSALKADATVYVRVETPFYAQLAKGVRSLLEDKVRERSGYFIQAARWVAEEASQRPGWLVNQVEGSREVDQGVLEEFRKRFLR